ncbi:MAG: cadherin repeat domain-containing protein, partial [Fibrobacter sp.]|nr:cadherin repeat domain-containing protein [Fibrobacter sp.]
MNELLILKKQKISQYTHKLFIAVLFVFFSATSLLHAQGFGEDAGIGMSTIDEGLLKFGLYGHDSVFIGYEAKTADSGVVGGGVVELEQGSVIRGDLYSFGDLVTNGNKNYQVFNGDLVVLGDAYLNDGFQVDGSFYVQGDLRIGGASKANIIEGSTHVGELFSMAYSNEFKGGVVVAQDSIITTSDYSANFFGTPPVELRAFVLRSGVHSAPQLLWSTPFTMPEHFDTKAYDVPTTVVNPGTNNITVLQDVSWDATMGSEPINGVKIAPNGNQVLPPGSYGHLKMEYNSELALGEGIYHFASIDMAATLLNVKVYQPNGGRTQILVEGDITLGHKNNIMPYDTVGNKGGTILIYSNGKLTIGQENEIWATLIAPNATLDMTYYPKLFGQAFAKVIVAPQYFEGNDGRYVPFYPAKPKIGLAFAEGNLVPEGSGGGTKIFPLTFSLEHENGLPVTVYFHTEFRSPAGPGHADADDINLIAKDSVMFEPGETKVVYDKLLINKDDDFELDDYFDLILDSVVNAELDSIAENNIYSLGIENDDPAPEMNFADPDDLLVDEAVGSINLAVKLTNKSVLESVAEIVVQSKVGILTYQVPDSVSVLAGETESYFVLTIDDDLIDAPDDTLLVILRTTNALTLTIGADSVKTIIVTDNDPSVKLSETMLTDFVVEEPFEGATTLKIPLVLAGVSGWDIPWALKVLPGSGATHATLDEDYRIVKANGKILAGQLSDTIIVEVLSDIWDEGDESFVLEFDPVAGKTEHLDYSGKKDIVVTIPRNGGPNLTDITIELNAQAPEGADVLFLREIFNRRDTVIEYNWNILPGDNAHNFAIKNKPGKAWVLEVFDKSDIDFVPGMAPFKLDVEVCSEFNCDTSLITIEITNIIRTPEIIVGDTMYVHENSPGGTKVDSLDVKSGSGWDLVWEVIGGTGVTDYIIDPETGIVLVKEGADLDYENEQSRTQTLQIRVTNSHDRSDTVWVVINLIDVLEYSTINIDVATIPGGKSYTNPDTLWVNSDSLDIEWSYDRGDSAETIGFAKDGVFPIIRKYCNPTKNFCASDTLVIRRNTKLPVVIWENDEKDEDLPKNTVVMPRDSGDTRIYTNDPQKILPGTTQYIDSAGNLVSIDVKAAPKLKEGKDVKVIYTFTDPYGNQVSDTLVFHLDTTPPVVKIFDPINEESFWVYNIDVGWKVDGVIMDTLNRASLNKGVNIIRRSYMDLAGNIGSDSVTVILSPTRPDVAIDLVKPLIT